jgi:thiamine biosynthesis lipoprotein
MIDPTTGRPITHKSVSASVLTDNTMMADAWSTAMLVLGSERGLAIAEEQGLAVLFIDHDGADGYVSKASSHFEALQA